MYRSTSSCVGIPLVAGMRMSGWLLFREWQSCKITTRRLPFHLIIEQVEQNADTCNKVHSIHDSINGSVGSNACDSSSCDTSSPGQTAALASVSVTPKESESVSRSGQSIQGTITCGGSQALGENAIKLHSARFTGSANPLTGAFDIVTKEAFGDHCDSACRLISRPGKLGERENSRLNHDVESTTPSNGSLLLGLWYGLGQSLTGSGAFFLNRVQLADEVVSSTAPIYPFESVMPPLGSASAVIQSIDDHLCIPYSHLMYFGLVEHNGTSYPMTFIAYMQPSEIEEDCYTAQGMLRIITGAHVQVFGVYGHWTVDRGLQVQVRRPKSLAIPSPVKLIPIEGEWQGRCEHDTADDSQALNSLSCFSDGYRLLYDFGHIALNGWNSQLPRQVITATLMQSHAPPAPSASVVRSTTRLHLYSLPRRILSHYDEAEMDEIPRDQLGLSHGYSKKQIKPLGDVSVIYEHQHGFVAAARLTTKLFQHRLTIMRNRLSFPLRFMPTSSPGVMIAVSELKDRTLLEFTPTIKPMTDFNIRFSATKQVLGMTAGGWIFCGMSNDYGEADGILVPDVRKASDCAPSGANLQFKPANALPSEYVSSCTGELFIGQWSTLGAIGKHKYRSRRGQWWELIFNPPNLIDSAKLVPADRQNECMPSAERLIAKTQALLREHRLKADELLRSFDKRANDSPQFRALLAAESSIVPVSNECVRAELPGSRCLIAVGNVELLGDTCLYRNDTDASLLHFRDLPHGFGMFYEKAIADSKSKRAGLPCGQLVYEGEFQYGRMHGFGYTSTPHPLRSEECIQSLGNFHQQLAKWFFHVPNAPNQVVDINQPISSISPDASHATSRLQQVCVTSGGQQGCPGLLTNLSAPSSAIGRVRFDKLANYAPDGIALQRFNTVARLALWQHSNERNTKHGPFFQLDFAKEIPLADQNGEGDHKVVYQLELLSGPSKSRVNHGRVHSTHPLLMQMCAAVEQQATEVDERLLAWLQATARFNEKRRRFHAMPVTGPTVHYTGFACVRCSVTLSFGNRWQCRHTICRMNFCSQCRGSSGWGNIHGGHDASHGPLVEFNEHEWKQYREQSQAKSKALRSSGGNMAAAASSSASAQPLESVNPAAAAAASNNDLLKFAQSRVHFQGNYFRLRAVASLTQSNPAQHAERPPLPDTLDLSFEGQREATLLAPRVQAALAEWKLPLQSPTKSLLGSSYQSPQPSTSSSSSLPSNAAMMPTVQTLLEQLNQLLPQCGEVVSLRDELVIDDAIPALLPDGEPVYRGTEWHRALGTPSVPIASILNLQVPSESPRESFNLLLLSRVRSLSPLLQWVRDRCIATIEGTQSSHKSEQGDLSSPPLCLTNSAIVTLHVLFAHCSALIRLVREEVTRDRKGSSSNSSGVARPTPPKFVESAKTSTLPALQLWIRLFDTKDLIIACIPLLENLQREEEK